MKKIPKRLLPPGPVMRTTVKRVGEPKRFDPILDHYIKACELACRRWTYYSVPLLPPSLNHYYKRGKGRVYRSEKADAFSQAIYFATLQKFPFKPTGTIAAVIVVESPNFLRKTREIREWDIDNMAKVVLDAFKKATGVDDSAVWDSLNFKQCSDRERTTLYLFDLGDIVEVITS